MPATFDDIQHAAGLLKQGGVVAFPTETVYGLGADAMNPRAVARVFELKGRPANNPLIVHVSGPEMAAKVAREWPAQADTLARRFWPGPLSILVPRSLALPAAVTAGSDLVAVRCPNHPVTLALLFTFGGPLVGPSANLSGGISPTEAEHVRSAFPEEAVYVLDGGRCDTGIESTVLDVTSDPPRILRPGAIGADDIAAVIGVKVLGPGEPDAKNSREGSQAGGPLLAPGLMERHYAPRTPAHLFDESDWPRVLEGVGRAVVLTHRLRTAPPPHRLIEMPPDAEGYAAGLYAALREADSANADVVLIERPPRGGSLWEAIADRLTRATTELPEQA